MKKKYVKGDEVKEDIIIEVAKGLKHGITVEEFNAMNPIDKQRTINAFDLMHANSGIRFQDINLKQAKTEIDSANAFSDYFHGRIVGDNVDSNSDAGGLLNVKPNANFVKGFLGSPQQKTKNMKTAPKTKKKKGFAYGGELKTLSAQTTPEDYKTKRDSSKKVTVGSAIKDSMLFVTDASLSPFAPDVITEDDYSNTKGGTNTVKSITAIEGITGQSTGTKQIRKMGGISGVMEADPNKGTTDDIKKTSETWSGIGAAGHGIAESYFTKNLGKLSGIKKKSSTTDESLSPDADAQYLADQEAEASGMNNITIYSSTPRNQTDIMNPDDMTGVGMGMAKGGSVKGAGTAKSDSIAASVEEGSFVVPAENAGIAEMLRQKYFPGTKAKADTKQAMGTNVKLSNGEHLFTPEEKNYLQSVGVDLNKLAPNAEAGNAYAKGTPPKGVEPDIEQRRKDFQKGLEERSKREAKQAKISELENSEKQLNEILSKFDKSGISDPIRKYTKQQYLDQLKTIQANKQKVIANKQTTKTVPATSAVSNVKTNASKTTTTPFIKGDYTDPDGNRNLRWSVGPNGWVGSDESNKSTVKPTAAQKAKLDQIYKDSGGGTTNWDNYLGSKIPGTGIASMKTLPASGTKSTTSVPAIKTTPTFTKKDITPPAGTLKAEDEKQGITGEDVLAAGQIGLGLYSLFKDGKRPVDKIDPAFNQTVNEAVAEGSFGFDPATKNLFQKQIETARLGQLGLANQTAGADPGLANARSRAATNQYGEGLVKLASADASLRLQKKQIANGLVTERAGMKRTLFQDNLRAFEQNQVAGADLLGAGITNYFTKKRDDRFREAIKDNNDTDPYARAEDYAKIAKNS